MKSAPGLSTVCEVPRQTRPQELRQLRCFPRHSVGVQWMLGTPGPEPPGYSNTVESSGNRKEVKSPVNCLWETTVGREHQGHLRVPAQGGWEAGLGQVAVRGGCISPVAPVKLCPLVRQSVQRPATRGLWFRCSPTPQQTFIKHTPVVPGAREVHGGQALW